MEGRRIEGNFTSPWEGDRKRRLFLGKQEKEKSCGGEDCQMNPGEKSSSHHGDEETKRKEDVK